MGEEEILSCVLWHPSPQVGGARLAALSRFQNKPQNSENACFLAETASRVKPLPLVGRGLYPIANSAPAVPSQPPPALSRLRRANRTPPLKVEVGLRAKPRLHGPDAIPEAPTLAYSSAAAVKFILLKAEMATGATIRKCGIDYVDGLGPKLTYR